MTNLPPRTILVTGDPICENNYYRGNRRTADSAEKRGFRVAKTPGGALMLKQLIETMTAIPALSHWQTEFGLKLNFEKLPDNYNAYCLWEPQVSNPTEKDEKKRFEVWRAVEPTLGYGQKKAEPVNEDERTALKKTGTPHIIVIDDPGLDFRNSKHHWPFPEKPEKGSKPSWVVLKLSGSIGEGDLWDKLVSCCDDNLVVIVPADQLRHSDLRLSSALSWEATVEDVLAELKYNPALKPLLSARHAIITFKSDGAFWLNNDKAESSRMLVFDSANAEGDWSALQGRGTVFGFLSCFTAAIVSELCRHVDDSDGKPKELNLEKVLAAGLGASRELRRLGHGLVKTPVPDNPEKYEDNPNPGFPFQEIANSIHKPTDKFVSSPLPAEIANRGKWMMLNAWQIEAQASELTRPHHEAALAVAVLGPNGLDRFPVARFGDLLTVDRSEIESLRSLRQLISSYQAAGVQKKPLSIGVFGPPGAGKSFGVTEISKAVLGEKVEPLTFNLSQFSNPTDLVGAFHQVRDRVLTGATPVVFWDEFDSQDYRWLQFLLAPMQDGAFQEGQIHHPIGKCIFIFAGATSPTFEHFGPQDPNTIDDEQRAEIHHSRLVEMEQQCRDFILKKGPDFKSRLAGYLNVLGPNPRQICGKGVRQWKDDPHDIYFPIRRAFFIRSKFKLKDSERLQIDPGILRALLEIPQYKAGARSLEFLCLHLRQSAPDIPRRSHLPGDYLLDMHVNADEFWRLCERDLPFRDAAKELAPGLHEDWRKGLSDKERQTNEKNKPWSDSDSDTRNASIAQALRIPELLAVAGLQVVAGDPLPADQEERVRQMLHDRADIIAEAEHNHWMVERLLSGWRYNPKRNNEQKLHHLLVPYAQLPESEKSKDLSIIYGRDNPRTPDIIERLKEIGWRIEPRP